ncbi:MAG TPA: DUF3160 domain-containing protein [Candidatus Eisenbacteria bacterium]|nr:DUF3160 domain-containing protein [Candidatus Eisenbacteria bacterium]
MMKRPLSVSGLLLCAMLLSGCSLWSPARPPAPVPTPAPAPTPAPQPSSEKAGFGESVTYVAPKTVIAKSVAKDFELSTVTNIAHMEKAYGFTFSVAEKRALAARKFVLKPLLETSIRPESGGDNVREFVQLYGQVQGSKDYKERGPANALFFSSDVFLHTYNNLYVELLKEMENKTFYPAMRSLSERFYRAAQANLEDATAPADKKKWAKVRDYLAPPYAIFSTAGGPLNQNDYYKEGEMRDPAKVQADHDAADAKIDTYDNAAAFVRNLHLGAASEAAVLADLKRIYDADDKGVPSVFKDEYDAFADKENVTFKVDFTQFTPRGTYTSSSLRRQYFRGMKWFIQVPFFLKSPDLTAYAFALTELMAEDPASLKDYDKLEAAIDFMVGTSDDLMPVDYLQALDAGKGTADPAAAAMAYLAKAREPKIKDLAAEYAAAGTEQSDEVRLKTKGMRFFSGKFIMDSYWTGFLTQGDEAPRPGYPAKLPPMASSLEVMALLGSSYAKSQIPKLDFYTKENGAAIDKALGELAAENAKLVDADWRRNLYTSWLWTIQSLFAWQGAHHDELPRFMQSPAWDAKTLMTASASWTELRHATILYAKQSFAELGAGFNENCDDRRVPPPPKAYIEPQLETYARLRYLAERTGTGLKEQGYELTNLFPLERFAALMDLVQEYVKKELADTKLSETVIRSSRPDPNDATKTCDEQVIDGESDWEKLRLGIISGLRESIPTPIEGPILPAKDRRAALVADVHTGGDSDHPTSILYEGTGVPYVIFAAVSDVNGPRLTAGFVSAHYEFTKAYGGKRLTDEEWQKNFYEGTDPYDAFHYTPQAVWPVLNAWYAPALVTP